MTSICLFLYLISSKHGCVLDYIPDSFCVTSVCTWTKWRRFVFINCVFSVEKENGDKLTHHLENWLSKPTCDIGQLDPVSYEELQRLECAKIKIIDHLMPSSHYMIFSPIFHSPTNFGARQQKPQIGAKSAFDWQSPIAMCELFKATIQETHQHITSSD